MQRDALDLLRRIAAGGDRHGRRREQQRDHGRQAQEPLGALDRSVDAFLGAAGRLQAPVGAARRVEPFAKRRDVGRVAGEELRIGRAAAGPDELRRLEVGEIHHQRGRKRIEAERLVGPVLEHALDDELARADRDRARRRRRRGARAARPRARRGPRAARWPPYSCSPSRRRRRAALGRAADSRRSRHRGSRAGSRRPRRRPSGTT